MELMITDVGFFHFLQKRFGVIYETKFTWVQNHDMHMHAGCGVSSPNKNGKRRKPAEWRKECDSIFLWGVLFALRRAVAM